MSRRLEELLVAATKRGFKVHSFDEMRIGPAVLALTYDHGDVADVYILHTATHATAFRAPVEPGADAVAPPTEVHWSMQWQPAPTLAALLALYPPGHPDDETNLGRAPSGLGLPAEGRRPVIIRMREHR